MRAVSSYTLCAILAVWAVFFLRHKRDPAPSPPPLPDVMATLDPSIAVLVIACNRENYIKETLDTLLKYRPSAELFPIIVSQDCEHEPTTDAIRRYGNRITHLKHPDLSEPNIPASERKIVLDKKAEAGYYKISRHYKWALSQVFDDMRYNCVIVVEDDLLVAEDFYSYFSELRPLLDSDPTLWCVSAWNDNGKSGYINTDQSDLLYRTDFFPGLGWMLRRRLWEELKPKWPLAYWDDWMREPEQRQERSCIRPEVSRTKTIGKMGVSTGQYFNSHLQYIMLNSDPVDFAKKNMNFLLKEQYDRVFVSRVLSLPRVSVNDVLYGQQSQYGEVQVAYTSAKDLENIAKRLRITSDTKAGVPRTAYLGIISIMYKGRRVHLTPPHLRSREAAIHCDATVLDFLLGHT